MKHLLVYVSHRFSWLLHTNKLKDSSEQELSNILRYRRYTYEVMNKMREYVSESGISPYARGSSQAFTPELWQFLDRNKSEDQWNKLLYVLTHPTIRPLAIQEILGREVWPPNLLDDLPYCEGHESLPTAAGGYHAEVIPSQESNHLLFPLRRGYNGRATSDKGLKARIYGHTYLLKFPYADVLRAREARLSGDPCPFLHFHEESLRLKAEVRFRITFRIPSYGSQQAGLRWGCIASLLESLDTIIFGTIPIGTDSNTRLSGWLYFQAASLELFRRLRPPAMPEPFAEGLNRAPPFRQELHRDSNFWTVEAEAFLRQTCLAQRAKTGRNRLSATDLRNVQRIMWSMGHYQKLLQIKARWEAIDQKQGAGQYYRAIMFEEAKPVLCALKTWTLENEALSGVEADHYFLRKAIHWRGVMELLSHMPMVFRRQWPEKRCRAFWDSYSNTILRAAVWNSIDGIVFRSLNLLIL